MNGIFYDRRRHRWRQTVTVELPPIDLGYLSLPLDLQQDIEAHVASKKDSHVERDDDSHLHQPGTSPQMPRSDG